MIPADRSMKGWGAPGNQPPRHGEIAAMLEGRGVEVRDHDRCAHPCRACDRGRGRPSGPVGALNRPSRRLDRSSDRCVGAVLRTRDTTEPVQRRALGIITLLLVVTVVAVAAFVIERGLCCCSFERSVRGILASALIAQRSLHEHVADAADALEKTGAEGGREAVSHIVGRDTEALDEAGVARAAIESLAENFSDGVVAPVVLDAALHGFPGAAVYKAINTRRQHDRPSHPALPGFRVVGCTPDDLVNLPASRPRLSSSLQPQRLQKALRQRRRGKRCVATLAATAPRTRYPEAAMAGALGSRLRARATTAASGSMMRSWAMAPRRRRSRYPAALGLYRRADGILIAFVAMLAIAFIATGLSSRSRSIWAARCAARPIQRFVDQRVVPDGGPTRRQSASARPSAGWSSTNRP